MFDLSSAIPLPPAVRTALLKIFAALSITVFSGLGFTLNAEEGLLNSMKETDQSALVHKNTTKPVEFMWGKSWNGTLSCPTDTNRGLVFNTAGQQFFKGGALDRNTNDFGSFTVLLDGRPAFNGVLYHELIDLKGAKTMTLKPNTPGSCLQFGTFWKN